MAKRLSGNTLLAVIGVLLAGALICHVIALSTNNWLYSARELTGGPGGGTFLRLGLWNACFRDYIHLHENPARLYTGCHRLYSEYFVNIRSWLIPCEYVRLTIIASMNLSNSS